MVFITLGTQDTDFSRCIKEVEKLIDKGLISDKVVAQVGHTKYRTPKIECMGFLSENDFKEYIRQADVIITHAGSGALFNSISYKKKVISIARLSRYGEMINDHQTELVSKLTSLGYILDGTFDLEKAWKQLDTFVPNTEPFVCTIAEEIESFINKFSNPSFKE